MLTSHHPNKPSPKTLLHLPCSKKRIAPRLEIPRFEPLSFSHMFSGILEDKDHSAESVDTQSSIDMYCNADYASIKDVTAEWENDHDHDSPVEHSLLNHISASFSQPKQTINSDLSQDTSTSSLPLIPNLSDVPPLSDFLFDPASLKAGVGVCIRRSDGRLYTVKKQSQTRRTWFELNILLKIKEARIPFAPLLHWTYERGLYIYSIMENYPTGSLADAIGHYGVFSSLDAFFYACELLIGLRFLHDIKIIHRNVSPETIIFDKRGHLVLSGIEDGIVLCSRDKHLFDMAGKSDRRYQAPEIILGWCHDDLVDSWSFGMVLYFMFHGKHAFLHEAQDYAKYSSKDVKKIILEWLPNHAIRFINPTAKDLILKCLERNPAMRATIRDIQQHAYFYNVDWDTVLKQTAPAPLPRDFFSMNVVCPSATPSNPDSSREQCFSPRVGAFSPEHCQQSFGQAAPRLLRSPFGKVLGTPAFEPVLQSTSDRETRISPHTVSVSPVQDVTRVFAEDSLAYKADFWDSLDREDQFSIHSAYSVFSNIKIPFSRAWDLRKQRSLIFYPRQLFGLSTTSIHQKLKRRPKSIAALKCAAYAEPIADLPSHLNQIGSGIGFTYTAPSRPPTAPASSQPLVSETTGTSYSDSDASSCPLPQVISRNSVSSNNTVAVPNACHGLFHSLSVSSFWAGFKNGSGGVSVTTTLPFHSKHHCAKDSEMGDVEGPLESPSSLPGPGLHEQSEEKGNCKPEISQPLAESTVFLSPVLEAFSPTISSSPTGSIRTEEEVFTPETINFYSTAVVRSSEEIVEMKRSEEAYQLCPESTLRLVTPMSGLRLALAGGSYLP